MERNENFNDEFARGFEEEAPALYDLQADGETSTPWACPWFWADFKDWFDEGLSAYEMGREWARKCFDELEEILEQEKRQAEED